MTFLQVIFKFSKSYVRGVSSNYKRFDSTRLKRVFSWVAFLLTESSHATFSATESPFRALICASSLFDVPSSIRHPLLRTLYICRIPLSCFFFFVWLYFTLFLGKRPDHLSFLGTLSFHLEEQFASTPVTGVISPERQAVLAPEPLCRSPLAHILPAELATTLIKNGDAHDKVTVQLMLFISELVELVRGWKNALVKTKKRIFLGIT